MAESEWRVELALFSDSFRSTVAGLVEELGGSVSSSKPGDDRHPAGADVILLLAGGAESEALDFLADSGSAGARYLIGAAADHRIAAAALQSGARDYFALPDDLDLLRRCLERLARAAASRIEAGRFADAERRATGFEAIVGSSPALQRTLDQAARVAPLRDLTVLIGGETGTGKELLARALHYGSPRAGDPFVEVNCAAIPSNLLESELFGHERGAFTGAVAAKPGLFEIAHGGTLFLDEIGTLPLELQPKLLRALETRSIRRVGGQQSRQVDVRVVAASHVDLGQAVRQGEFREDLYYRLNVVTLVLPPLREREGDVELLAHTFVQRIATSYGLPVPELSQETRTALRAHRWPGNVRELRNVLERAVVLSPPGTLRLGPLEDARARADTSAGVLPFPAPLAEVVRTAAQAMLDLTGGNKSEAARRLGISRPRLQRLLDGNLEE
jgi:two-component system response regulator HydG